MGSRRLQPCNLTPDEQKEAWDRYDEYLGQEEEEQVMELMENYLFYYRDDNGRSRECICTHPGCGRFVMERKYEKEFFSHHHGDEIKCPVCGGIVKLISLGKVRNFRKINETKWTRVTICKADKDGALLLMSAYVNRFYSWNELRPCLEVSWKARTWLKPGKRMQWLREPVWGCRQWEFKWHPCSFVQEPFRPSFYGEGGDSYIIGTDQIGMSDLKYCQVEDWYSAACAICMGTGDDPVRNVVKYLSAYTRYPLMEMAVKLDMHKLVTELVEKGRKNARYINWDASNIHGFLRLNKQDAKEFVNAGGELDLLKVYRIARENNITKNMAEFISLCREVGGMHHAERITELAVKCGCSVRVAVNYISKMPGTNRDVMTTWMDYLNMAGALEYDMSRQDVLMPKDLQQRHDAAAETIRYRKQMIDSQRHKAMNNRLRKMYEFEYGDLCIVVPGSPEDIIQEGKVLHHCVGGYAARHFEEKLVILFLRHKRRPTVPFVTIELKHRDRKNAKVEIRQIHGYKNETYKPNGGKRPARPQEKYAWFIDMWCQWLLNGSKRDKKGRPILPAEKEKSA